MLNNGRLWRTIFGSSWTTLARISLMDDRNLEPGLLSVRSAAAAVGVNYLVMDKTSTPITMPTNFKTFLLANERIPEEVIGSEARDCESI